MREVRCSRGSSSRIAIMQTCRFAGGNVLFLHFGLSSLPNCPSTARRQPTCLPWLKELHTDRFRGLTTTAPLKLRAQNFHPKPPGRFRGLTTTAPLKRQPESRLSGEREQVSVVSR